MLSPELSSSQVNKNMQNALKTKPNKIFVFIQLVYFCGMFFFLSKILVFLISPLTWVFTLLAFTAFSKDPVRKKKLFIIALASLYFFSNSFIADEAMRLWEITTPDLKPTQKYEYAVVLSGMIWYDARQDKPQFMRSSDRIFQTLPLLQSGQIKKLIISGGSGSISHPEEKEAAILKDYLVKT